MADILPFKKESDAPKADASKALDYEDFSNLITACRIIEGLRRKCPSGTPLQAYLNVMGESVGWAVIALDVELKKGGRT
jgi:hypothetical protein